MTARRRGCSVLALAMVLVGSARLACAEPEVRQKLRSTRQDLKQLEGRLRQGRQQLSQNVKAEKDILGQLEAINRESESARRDARVHVRNLGLVEDKLAALREKQAQAQAQEESDRTALRAQLRAVQRSRSRQGAALLFSARTPAQWSARSSALRQLSLGTRRKVLGLRNRLDLLEMYRVEGVARQVELQRRRGEAESARRRAQHEAARRQALLKRVQHKKALAQQTVAALELSAGRLQQLMEALQKESQQKESQRAPRARPNKGGPRVAQTTNGPSTVHGRVPWPVRGRVLSRFGMQRHPIFNVNVFNRGIEIAAAFGSPIKAIAAGTVEHVGEMQDFGKLVVVDHGGGLKSVYGYASQALVKKDQVVAQGEDIAEVGEHGTAGQPTLYFQISQNAKPQDPLRYLSWR